MNAPFHPQTESLVGSLRNSLSELRFREVADCSRTIPDAILLLKRQTWNSNRAVVVLSLPGPPSDLKSFLRVLRKQVAFRCKFFPFFWGIGIQVIIIAPGFAGAGLDVKAHVAKVDNQWSIVQSLFLVDLPHGSYRATRTWGQFLTGKFQDAISEALSENCGLKPQ